MSDRVNRRGDHAGLSPGSLAALDAGRGKGKKYAVGDGRTEERIRGGHGAQAKRRAFAEEVEMHLQSGELESVVNALFSRAKSGNAASNEALKLIAQFVRELPSQQVEIGGISGKPLETMDMTALTAEQLQALLDN